MPIGNAVFMAGAYTITWNSLALGIMRGDEQSPVLEYTALGRAIDNTDRYGRTRIDGIYQGGNWRATYTCEEYKAGPIAAAFPFGAIGVLGVIGRLWSDIAQSLVLTSTAGTPAVATPATLTASKVLLAENFPVRLLFGPILREVPMQQMLLPYTQASTDIWFSQT